MPQIGSALASTIIGDELSKEKTELIFATNFKGSLFGCIIDSGAGASYAAFYKYQSGHDVITGYNFDNDLQETEYGAGIWQNQQLTSYLDGSKTVSNVAGVISATITPISQVDGELSLNLISSPNARGSANPPQTHFSYIRSLVGGVRQADVPVLCYEFDVVLPRAYETALAFPNEGVGGANWSVFSEFKTGMCNNGLPPYTDTANAGDHRWKAGFMANLSNGLPVQFQVIYDDGGNNAAFDIPGVTPTGQPRVCQRQRFVKVPEWVWDTLVHFRLYIKRPANYNDVTSGRHYASVIPYKADGTLDMERELVLGKWIGGHQMGPQSGPLERLFFCVSYTGASLPITQKFRRLRIYKDWPWGQNPCDEPMQYEDATAFMELTHSLNFSIGQGEAEFARAGIATVFDHEGKLLTLKSGVPRFYGARYITNLFASTTTLATQDVTLELKTYTVSFTGTGTIAFSGVYAGSSLVGTGYNNRVQKTFTCLTAGICTFSVSGNCRNAQFEDVTGQADQSAGEYVPVGAPITFLNKYGCFADGVQAFNTKQDGSAISPDILKGLRFTPVAKINKALWCRDFSNAVWQRSGVTAVKNQVGSDGATGKASLLTATAPNGIIYQNITEAASAGATGFLLKRGIGTGSVFITRDLGLGAGATWLDITSSIGTDEFFQAKIENSSVLNPVIGIKFGTSGDTLIADYAMNHLGATLDLPIYTEGSPATLAAETCRYMKNGNTSSSTDQYSITGTWLATIEKDNWAYDANAIVGSSTIGLFLSNTYGVSAKDGTNTINALANGPITGAHTIALRYDTNTLQACFDNVWGSVGSFDGSMNLTTYIELGLSSDCFIKNLAFWDQITLTDAELTSVLGLPAVV